jgi:23S rRNA (adenine1618-N6)-methyltransferase
MTSKKRVHPSEKKKLHPRNKHRERYNFKELIASCSELAPFVHLNNYREESINFFDPAAVKMLNKALLKHFYGIEYWDIPKNYLCPPIPGRADYIHHIVDLLSKNKVNTSKIRCLDIGVGANCVYPIIGVTEYGWSFVGSDIDAKAIDAATTITDSNLALTNKVELRLQTNSADIFKGIIKDGEHFDITICNPPFHSSLAEAQASTLRKVRNLTQKKIDKPTLNFGGQHTELWCEGGDAQFVQNMIKQSAHFTTTCNWFSTLISKESNLNSCYKTLEHVNATKVETIPMGQGNKKSRIVAWTYAKQ